MTSIKTVVVAGLLSMMAAAPAFAQEAIQEPGAFAFYYPNLDVLNGGAPTPAYRMEGMPPSVMQNYNERKAGWAAPTSGTMAALTTRPAPCTTAPSMDDLYPDSTPTLCRVDVLIGANDLDPASRVRSG